MREDRLMRRRYRSGMGGMLIGGLIVIVGLVLLLDNLGILDAREFWRFWPVGLIAVGALLLLPRPDRGESACTLAYRHHGNRR